MSDSQSSKWKTLLRVELLRQHTPTGHTKHRISESGDVRDFPPFVRLEIAHFEGDDGFYLLYYPETGHGTDTWHESLEDAMHQAEFEFNVKREDWTAQS